ncbi:hypothetical protein K8I28_05955 [bacterium]|nr:hypothetical protein [bacterium]
MIVFARNTLNVLLVVFLTFAILGCEEPASPVEAKKVRGVALASLAQDYGQAMGNQFLSLRDALIFTRLRLVPFDPASDETFENLESIHTTLGGRVTMSGVMDVDGIIRRVYPTEYDTIMQGEDRSGESAVQSILDDPTSLSLAKLSIDTVGNRSVDYLVSLQDGADLVGILWMTVNVDTLIDYAFSYSTVEDSVERDIFVLDWDGMIIHDSNIDLWGTSLLDSTMYNIELVEIAGLMLDEVEGFDQYLADPAPGMGTIGGERVVGWSHFNRSHTFWKPDQWVIAITEPLE